GGQPPQSLDPRGQVQEDEPRVCEVEIALPEWIGEQVVSANLDAVVRERLQQPRLEIGCEDAARRADALGQQPRDRSGAGTDLEAAPSLGDAERVQRADRERAVVLRAQPPAA